MTTMRPRATPREPLITECESCVAHYYIDCQIQLQINFIPTFPSIQDAVEKIHLYEYLHIII